MTQEEMETVDKLTGANNSDTPTLPRLPEEIWEKILLEKLTSSSDIRSAANTCSDWKRILYPKRILWQFPEIFPLLLKYIGKKDVLNCRLVCKSWSQGVDEYLESGTSTFEPFSMDFGCTILNREQWGRDGAFPYTYNLPFNYHRKDIQLHSEMSRHPRCPIIGRAASLQYCGANFKNLPWDQLTQFPKWFCSHIRHLNLNLSFQGHTPQHHVVMIVHAAIENMPLLVQLRISADFNFTNPTSIGDNSEAIFLEYYLQHNELKVPQRPLTQLKMLALILNFTGDLSSPAYDFIMEYFSTFLLKPYSNQLERFEVCQWDKSYSSLDWEHLAYLCIFTAVSDCRKFTNDMSDFEAPNLRQLSVSATPQVGSKRFTYYKQRNRLAYFLERCIRLVSLSINNDDEWILTNLNEADSTIQFQINPKLKQWTTLKIRILFDTNNGWLPKYISRFCMYFGSKYSSKLTRFGFETGQWNQNYSYENWARLTHLFTTVRSCKILENGRLRAPNLKNLNINLIEGLSSTKYTEERDFVNILTCLPSLESISVSYDYYDKLRKIGLKKLALRRANKWSISAFPSKKDTINKNGTAGDIWNMFPNLKSLRFFLSEGHSRCTIDINYNNSRRFCTRADLWSLWGFKVIPKISTTRSYWNWKTFDYCFFIELEKRFPFDHSICLDMNSPSFATADFWMNKVVELQELFPTVEAIRFNHSPILESFLACFPNVKRLQIPSATVLYNWRSDRPDRVVYGSYNILPLRDIYLHQDPCPDNFKKSKVWDLLPTLQEIEVTGVEDYYLDYYPNYTTVITRSRRINTKEKTAQENKITAVQSIAGNSTLANKEGIPENMPVQVSPPDEQPPKNLQTSDTQSAAKHGAAAAIHATTNSQQDLTSSTSKLTCPRNLRSISVTKAKDKKTSVRPPWRY